MPLGLVKLPSGYINTNVCPVFCCHTLKPHYWIITVDGSTTRTGHGAALTLTDRHQNQEGCRWGHYEAPGGWEIWVGGPPPPPPLFQVVEATYYITLPLSTVDFTHSPCSVIHQMPSIRHITPSLSLLFSDKVINLFYMMAGVSSDYNETLVDFPRADVFPHYVGPTVDMSFGWKTFSTRIYNIHFSSFPNIYPSGHELKRHPHFNTQMSLYLCFLESRWLQLTHLITMMCLRKTIFPLSNSITSSACVFAMPPCPRNVFLNRTNFQ